MKHYSAVAGAVLAVGGGAEAAVTWSGLVNLEFGTSTAAITPIMQGVSAEFQLAGKGNGFAVFGIGADSKVFLGGIVKTNLVGTVSANSTAMVGPGLNEPDVPGAFFYTTEVPAGEWDTDGVGLAFAFRFQEEDSENLCYGWAEVERVDETNGILHQWAYDCMNPIKVGAIPEPGAMGLFALGAAGLAAFRRRRSAADR